MNNQITITIGNSNRIFFLQNGFYKRETGVSHLHKHYHTELHMVIDGSISYTVGKKKHTIEDGEIIAIPHNTIHSCNHFDKSAKHCAFLIDFPIRKTLRANISPQTLKDFFAEIEKVHITNNYAKISGYLTLIYNTVFDTEVINVKRIDDYSFIIEEYLKTHYSRDIKLSDLASELNLSEKHTERLVKKYTGNTFKQELASIRIKTAQMLIASTDMTMTEIGEYVGYNSYSGFYKAYKKNI